MATTLSSGGARTGGGTLTQPLLAGGIAAGPLFIGMSLIQAFTRRGYDLRRHPVSLLLLGDQGWIQLATFVLTGLLAIACAAGFRRALHHGRAGTWGPLLVGLYGLALIIAGVFPPDPHSVSRPERPMGCRPCKARAAWCTASRSWRAHYRWSWEASCSLAVSPH
jgi:hypothetical protein